MAQELEAAKIWYTNTAGLSYRTFDIEELSDGRVLVAFGGNSGVNATINTAILSTRTDTLGEITSTFFPSSNISGPGAALNRVTISAGDSGRAMLTYQFFNAAIALPDGNFSVATQVFAGSRPPNPIPRLVNPGGEVENTSQNFSTVGLADGRYATFFTEPGSGFTNLSNGIRMTVFDRFGRVETGPTTVIGEVIVNPLVNLQNNPENPTAVLLGNGNIGLLYKESASTGAPRILFQELTAAGAKVGSAIEITNTSTLPKINTLDNGNLLFTWFDPQPGEGHKGRIFDTNGDPVDVAFDVSTGDLQPFSGANVTAIDDGFVFSWFDTLSGIWVAQVFDLTGTAKGNPFLLTENAGDFGNAGTTGGVLRQDGGFLGYLVGAKIGAFTGVFEGQLFGSGATLGLALNGGLRIDRLNGAALDDVLDGRGGNDVLTSLAGNDILVGGLGNDKLFGGADFDRMSGDDGNDTMYGGADLDLLYGGLGNDRIYGGEGADKIVGGVGADTLTGGAGADLFIFNSIDDAVDVITDFNAADGDKLKIPAGSFGFLGFWVTVSNEANPTVSGLHFNPDTHILSHDRDGTGTFYARNIIAELPGVTTLSFNEILTF